MKPPPPRAFRPAAERLSLTRMSVRAAARSLFVFVLFGWFSPSARVVLFSGSV